MLRMILAAWILTAAALTAQTVEGHVVNSVTGDGIPGVTVYLFQGGQAAYSTTTGPLGRFRIDAVKDGAYNASYVARDFRLPNTPGGNPPFQVTSGAEPVHLEAKLLPLARISGRVL